MRRRLDIAPLPFLQPDGRFYSLTESGDLIPYVSDDRDAQSMFNTSEGGGVELSSAPLSVLTNHQDYVARARYLVDGNNASRSGGNAYVDPQSLPPTDIKRNINKLSRAVSELRIGILSVFFSIVIHLIARSFTLSRRWRQRSEDTCRGTHQYVQS